MLAGAVRRQNARMSPWLFDFAYPRAVLAWGAIDDRVMGGVSRSPLRYDPVGHAVFEGEVPLQTNGGFASVRSSPGPRGQFGATLCLIDISGQPRQYKLSHDR
jgi:NADH dehydrogenase [ubiquinone] 1 alpha subcomplex assembly factor 1